MFKALFQVSWKFNLAIETMSNTWLEPNYRVALIELEHRMQNHIYCIFVSTLQTHAKCFHFRTLCVNNLELDNFHNKREGSFFLKLFEFYFYLFFVFFFCFNAFRELFSSLRHNLETFFSRKLEQGAEHS